MKIKNLIFASIFQRKANEKDIAFIYLADSHGDGSVGAGRCSGQLRHQVQLLHHRRGRGQRLLPLREGRREGGHSHSASERIQLPLQHNLQP